MFYFVGTVIIIFAFCVFFISIADLADGYRSIKMIMTTIISGAIGIFFVVSMVGVKNATPVITETLESSISLTAIKDNSNIEGRFSGSLFCMRGYIGETEYIQFVITTADNGKEIRKVKADESKFYETDSDFRLETYICAETKTFLCFWDTTKVMVYKFYVPYGTITNEFSIDLEGE